MTHRASSAQQLEDGIIGVSIPLESLLERRAEVTMEGFLALRLTDSEARMLVKTLDIFWNPEKYGL